MQATPKTNPFFDQCPRRRPIKTGQQRDKTSGLNFEKEKDGEGVFILKTFKPKQVGSGTVKSARARVLFDPATFKPQAGCRIEGDVLKCPIKRSNAYSEKTWRSEELDGPLRYKDLRRGDVIEIETFKTFDAGVFDIIKVFGGQFSEWCRDDGSARHTLRVTSIGKASSFAGTELTPSGLHHVWSKTMKDLFMVPLPKAGVEYGFQSLLFNCHDAKGIEGNGSVLQAPVPDEAAKKTYENKDTGAEEPMLGGSLWGLVQVDDGGGVRGQVDMALWSNHIDHIFGVNDPEMWKKMFEQCVAHLHGFIPAYVNQADQDRMQGNSLNDPDEPKPTDMNGDTVPFTDFYLRCHVGEKILTDQKAYVRAIGYPVTAAWAKANLFQAANVMSPYYEKNTWNKPGTEIMNLKEWNGNVHELLDKGKWDIYLVPENRFDEEDDEEVRNMDMKEREAVFTSDGKKKKRGSLKCKLTDHTLVYAIKNTVLGKRNGHA